MRRAILFFLGDPQDFDGDGDEELTDLQFTVYLCVSLALVLMAGLMSGLTLGWVTFAAMHVWEMALSTNAVACIVMGPGSCRSTWSNWRCERGPLTPYIIWISLSQIYVTKPNNKGSHAHGVACMTWVGLVPFWNTDAHACRC